MDHRLVLLLSLAALLAVTVSATAAHPEIPVLASSLIPADFAFDEPLSRLLQANAKHLLDHLDEDLQAVPVTVGWWAFTYPGSVETAYHALAIPADAISLPPMVVSLADQLSAYLSQSNPETLVQLWGEDWYLSAEQALPALNSRLQNLAMFGLWQTGNLLVPADDPTELVTVEVFLAGSNVSAYSGGMILADDQGSIAGFLQPAADGHSVIGRALPGRYELMIIYDHDGTQAIVMDTVAITVLAGQGAATRVELTAWDLPFRLPWSLDDILTAETELRAPEQASISYLSFYLVNPLLELSSLELVPRTHLLVSCLVEGEWDPDNSPRQGSK